MKKLSKKVIKVDAQANLKAMLDKFQAGAYVAPNSVNGKPSRDFSHLPDDVTVYAHL